MNNCITTIYLFLCVLVVPTGLYAIQDNTFNPVLNSPGSLNPAGVRFGAPSIITNDVFHGEGSIFNSGLNNAGLNFVSPAGNSSGYRGYSYSSGLLQPDPILSSPSRMLFAESYQPEESLGLAVRQTEQFFSTKTNGQGWINLFELKKLEQIASTVSELTEEDRQVLDLVNRRIRWLETRPEHANILALPSVQMLDRRVQAILSMN